MPDGVKKGDAYIDGLAWLHRHPVLFFFSHTSHEEVMSGKVGIVDEMNSVQLTVNLEHLMACFGDLNEHGVLILAFLDIGH